MKMLLVLFLGSSSCYTFNVVSHSEFLFAFLIFCFSFILFSLFFILELCGREIQQKHFSGALICFRQRRPGRRNYPLPGGRVLSHATWKRNSALFFSMLALGEALTRDLPSQEACVDKKEG